MQEFNKTNDTSKQTTDGKIEAETISNQNVNANVKTKKPIYKKWWFWLLIIILIIGVGSSDDNSTNTSNTNKNTSVSEEIENTSSLETYDVTDEENDGDATEEIEYISVTVDQLDDALDSNAAAAKAKYIDQYVAITGRLGTIDSDLKYIAIYSTTNMYDLIGIHCTITDDEQKNTILQLSTDDTIIVKGQITDVGEILGYYVDIIEVYKK